MSSESTFVVICNGPSLKGFDFNNLKGYKSIGMNSAYRMFEKINFWPDFWTCADTRVGLYHAAEFERLAKLHPVCRFYVRNNTFAKIASLPNVYRIISENTNNPSLKHHHGEKYISTYIPHCTGSIAASIGISLGYKHIVLLGADCNYVERVPGCNDLGQGRLTYTDKSKNNPNYWFDDYQLPGDEYHLPNCVTVHLKGWKSLYELSIHRNIKITNCSKLSTIPFFKKEKISNVLNN